MVVLTDTATSRLGEPLTTMERGTIERETSSYSQRWNWPCGCAGEVIGGALIELRCCELHAT